MEKRVLNDIIEDKMIMAGDRVLIGVSGGADSLALLYFLDKFKQYLKIEIGVAHLHHQLRGDQADADEFFVLEFCRERMIPFFSTRKNIQKISKQKKISIEEAGRLERYSYFERLAKDKHYNRIALGHHLNDQAETMLMRLIRGTGIKGVSAMQANRDGVLIRPFLGLEKKEILAYCIKNKLSYRTDVSNFQLNYTRNRIRLEIMPQILDINPKADQHFFEFTKIANDYQVFLQDYVNKIEDQVIDKADGIVHLDRQKWLPEKAIVQAELLRRAIIQFKGSLKEIEYNHIVSIQQLLKSNKTVGEIHIPLGIKVVRRYDHVRIEHQVVPLVSSYRPRMIMANKTYIISFFRLILETEKLDSHYFKTHKNNILKRNHKNHSEKYFDYDRISKGLCLRSRQTGDFFYPIGLSGKKTIKKFLIDRKVEQEKRDLIPLLANKNEIIWIAGYGINERLLVDETSENALRIKIILC